MYKFDDSCIMYYLSDSCIKQMVDEEMVILLETDYGQCYSCLKLKYEFGEYKAENMKFSKQQAKDFIISWRNTISKIFSYDEWAITYIEDQVEFY